MSNMIASAGRANDGYPRALKVDDSGRLESSLGETFATPQENMIGVTLESGETKTIFTVEDSIRFDWLVWSTNREEVSIAFRNGENVPMGDLVTGNSQYRGFMPFSARNIVQYRSSFFEINLYQTNDYKFTLSRPLHLSPGATISVTNNGTDESIVSVRGYGVMFK